jgi:hypothetical protein
MMKDPKAKKNYAKSPMIALKQPKPLKELLCKAKLTTISHPK